MPSEMEERALFSSPRMQSGFELFSHCGSKWIVDEVIWIKTNGQFWQSINLKSFNNIRFTDKSNKSIKWLIFIYIASTTINFGNYWKLDCILPRTRKNKAAFFIYHQMLMSLGIMEFQLMPLPLHPPQSLPPFLLSLPTLPLKPLEHHRIMIPTDLRYHNQPKSDYIYNFQYDFKPNEISTGSKSMGKW